MKQLSVSSWIQKKQHKFFGMDNCRRLQVSIKNGAVLHTSTSQVINKSNLRGGKKTKKKYNFTTNCFTNRRTIFRIKL